MKSKKTYVTIELDPELKELLEKSIELSGRSKRKEAFMRLKDHLLRFDTITKIGSATEKD
ncbi:conjugal transfer protein TraY (plasmid) [Plesiomonas shigelloides]|uniref:TraY domain-containing protein n=1 Tax=Plesiomonas shigelloides TaxID=703 RepID=UPI000D12C2F9|nr:TraY domain-containing protein [Plesiomonas shigelloides]AVQ89175.1 conjugal transfer protein TraY [Plesiomonas shigelloides]